MSQLKTSAARIIVSYCIPIDYFFCVYELLIIEHLCDPLTPWTVSRSFLLLTQYN